MNKTNLIGKICSMKPDGNVCIIINVDFSRIDIYEAIMLSGTYINKKIYIRSKQIASSRICTNEDIEFYKLNNIFKLNPSLSPPGDASTFAM
jgi:hypothetical protein